MDSSILCLGEVIANVRMQRVADVPTGWPGVWVCGRQNSAIGNFKVVLRRRGEENVSLHTTNLVKAST